MKRGLRILLLVGAAAAVLVGLRATRSDDTGAAAVTVQEQTEVRVDDLAVTVSATGTMAPARQVGLAFELAAPVREILVEEGQAVQAGDVLARLDTRNLEVALENARISLDAQQVAYDALTTAPREVDIAVARAALNIAQAQAGSVSLGADATQLEITRLQAELARNQLWQAQLQRDLNFAIPPAQRDFAEANGIALPDTDQMARDTVPTQLKSADYEVLIADENYAALLNQGPDVAGLSSASAQIAAAQAQLEKLLNGPTETDLQIAGAQLQIARLAVEQAATNLSRGVLTAPFAGVVAQNNLVIGELPPQDAAMQLIDPSGFYVDVAVDETDIVDVQPGQAVTLALDALPGETITGTVTRVAARPVRAGQLVTYTVRVTLDAARQPLRAGMTATATIVVNELRDVLVLPNRFIRLDRATQQAYVTVERGGQYAEVAVQLGLRNETDSQIVSGLEAGQAIVLLPRETFNPIPGG
ncbi:MAG: HlyD family efflux transporter periplasmic adaptor subunit [Chloroflexi bacterium]|nr:HlyD family efflux transporter periplasmic adaptor subunit [Chloroflexota bacterium]